MQTLIGTVLKNKNAKTILVAVPYIVTHPLYHKQFKRTSKLQVHNEMGEVAIGSSVKIVSCSPVSKMKNFKLVEVVKIANDKKEMVEEKTVKTEKVEKKEKVIKSKKK